MIRMRLAAPWTMAAGLILAGVTMTLSAQTHGLTRPEMESFVYVTIATAGVCVFGAFWVLLATLNSRSEKHMERVIGHVTEKVGTLSELMQDHHLDPLAHPAGSANRINPVMERLAELDNRLRQNHELLVKLHAEHTVIRGQEDETCRLVRQLADFKKNAARRRATDPPGFDATSVRVETEETEETE